MPPEQPTVLSFPSAKISNRLTVGREERHPRLTGLDEHAGISLSEVATNNRAVPSRSAT